MRVVITGATGNVGTSLLNELASEPAVHEIMGIARRLPRVSPTKTVLVARDVTRDGLDDVMWGADALVHLAWIVQPARQKKRRWRNNVEGTRRVLESAVRAGVRNIVYASSVGVYSPAPKDRRVSESWPRQGISGAPYSIEKAAVEALLDGFEADHPLVRVVRLRPALSMKFEAAAEIRKLFFGPLIPTFLFRHMPAIPDIPALRFQVVHSADVADAYRRALLSDVRGAFNIAAEPIIDAATLSEVLGARRMPLSKTLLRGMVSAAFQARLDRAGPEWAEMALRSPLLDSSRAERELGWKPRVTAVATVRELARGLGEDAGLPTPPLVPRHGRMASFARAMT